MLEKATIGTKIRDTAIGAILVKVVFVAIAVAGYSNLVFAFAADVGMTLVVIVCSLGLMRFGHGK